MNEIKNILQKGEIVDKIPPNTIASAFYDVLGDGGKIYSLGNDYAFTWKQGNLHAIYLAGCILRNTNEAVLSQMCKKQLNKLGQLKKIIKKKLSIKIPIKKSKKIKKKKT